MLNSNVGDDQIINIENEQNESDEPNKETQKLINKSLIFQYIVQCRKNEIYNIIKDPSIDFWNFQEDGNTVLHKSINFNHIDIFKLFLTSIESNPTLENKNKILHELINTKNKNDYTPLHYTVLRGYLEMTKILIEKGADITITNRDNQNVLHLSCLGNQPTIFYLFKCKYNIDPNSIDNKGKTPLHLACEVGNDLIVDFLLSMGGINLNVQDKDGNTPLHCALLNSRFKIIKKLAMKGADLFIKNNNNKSPIQLSKESNLSIIRNYFKSRNLCEKLFLRPKISKNKKKYNFLIIFVLIHILVAAIGSVILLPFINSLTVSIVYFFIFFVLMVFFIILCLYRHKTCNVVDKEKYLLSLIDQGEEINSYCPYCCIKKIMNTKHCVICNKCIQGFDHHCIWVENCIGEDNYNIFVTFVIMIFVNLILNFVVAIIALTEKSRLSHDDRGYPFRIRGDKWFYTFESKICFCVLFLISAILFAFPIVTLIYNHTTSCIKKIQKKRNPYENIKDPDSMTNESSITDKII